MINEHVCDSRCKTMYSLELLRSVALEKARKYRWDPAIGPMHEAYFESLTAIIEAERKEVSNA